MAASILRPELWPAGCSETVAKPETLRDASNFQEIKQADAFRDYLASQAALTVPISSASSPNASSDDLAIATTSAFSTFLLHVQARMASMLGEGFYTIGPCGEETVSAFGLALRDSDPCALHYRHVAAQISRQLLSGKDLDEILLDRARAYACSTLDPVTGGVHCALGSGTLYDPYVTSTLASQAPSAVGRGLAIPLSNAMLNSDALYPSDAVSFVSVGDGSVNNAMFLAALNMSEYAQHRSFKCPIVFGN